MTKKFTPGPWGATPIALLGDDRVTLSVLRVYVALSSFQGMKDDCSPEMSDIAERAHLSARQVIRSTHVLKKLDWVEIKRRGQGKTNVYRVRMDVRSDNPSKPRGDTDVTSEDDGSVSQQELPTDGSSLILDSSLDPYINNTEKTVPAPAGPFRQLMQFMEELHGGQYASYKKEGPALSKLLERVGKMYPGGDAAEKIRFMGKYLRSLSRGHDRFWAGMPVSPSSLLCHWDRLFALAKAKASAGNWEHMSSPLAKSGNEPA